MHEAAFAQAAQPALVSVLGMELRPYSLGHELFLIRECNPIAAGAALVTRAQLAAAVLICCQNVAETQAMNRDPFIGVKLALWRWRTRRRELVSELAAFEAYRVAGSAEFKCNEPRANGGKIRYPGAPFLLRVFQFLVIHLRKSEAEAWDYPLGLAKMQWAAYWEGQGGLEIYNRHDAQFDKFCAEQEALLAAVALKAKEAKCPA